VASRSATESETDLSQATNGEKSNRESSRQLVIDVNQMDGEAVEQVSTTKVVKQIITQGIKKY
jgi:hypothetical protein